jgi:NADH-quinone oxidoreductase subunit N
MTNFLYLPEQLKNILKSIDALLPEVLLSTAFLLMILIDLILYYDQRNKQKFVKNTAQTSSIIFIFCLISVVIITYQIAQQFSIVHDSFLFDRMLVLDLKAILFKFLILLSTFFILAHIYVTKREFVAEFFPLLISMVIGLCLMTMSVNLLMIYLSIEIVSVSSYLLSTINKTRKSTESGLKYILFGASASAVMLYGMSLLYGMTGTLDITSPEFSRGLYQVDSIALTVAIVMTISGFMFKISASPFHIWTPDVYESAPTPVVAFFSVAPKIAAFLVAIRFYFAVPNNLQTITAVLAMASITFGNFSALWQNNAKRLLAYSTIAHSGFMLIGLVTMSQLGITSVVFYLIVTLFTNLAAFLLLDYANQLTIINEQLTIDSDFAKGNFNKSVGSLLEKTSTKAKRSPENQTEASDASKIENLKGLGRLNPFYGIMMLLVMISLAGIPPTAGFFAKLNIFSALWETYQTSNQPILLWLFIFGLLNTAIGLFFYLKIPFYLFFKEPLENQVFELNSKQYFLVIILILPILILFFKADWLMNLISYL